MVKAIPEGSHSITPAFTFKDSGKAIDFYKKAFGAEVLGVFKNLDGKGIMHASIRIGDSILMMGDENKGCKSAETLGSSPMNLFLYVEDADAAFKRAVDAGCKAMMPVADMFWGDRAGNVTDPFGYRWMIATHKRDLTPEQIRKEAETFFAQWAKNHPE